MTGRLSINELSSNLTSSCRLLLIKTAGVLKKFQVWVRFSAGNISAAWSVYIAEGNKVVESRLAKEGLNRPRDVSALVRAL